MSKSVAEINIELFYYQCCLADLAVKYIDKEVSGHQNINCLLNKLILGTEILESLKCPQNILDQDCLSQLELEALLEKLSDICGCTSCKDRDEVFDDTISTTLADFIEL